jgi:hypothetical protein
MSSGGRQRSGRLSIAKLRCSFARHSVENSSTILRTRAGGALHHGEPYLTATFDWILCRVNLCSSDILNLQQLSRVPFKDQLLFRF